MCEKKMRDKEGKSRGRKEKVGRTEGGEVDERKKEE